jgi:hypothetical protein
MSSFIERSGDFVNFDVKAKMNIVVAPSYLPTAKVDPIGFGRMVLKMVEAVNSEYDLDAHDTLANGLNTYTSALSKQRPVCTAMWAAVRSLDQPNKDSVISEWDMHDLYERVDATGLQYWMTSVMLAPKVIGVPRLKVSTILMLIVKYFKLQHRRCRSRTSYTDEMRSSAHALCDYTTAVLIRENGLVVNNRGIYPPVNYNERYTWLLQHDTDLQYNFHDMHMYRVSKALFEFTYFGGRSTYMPVAHTIRAKVSTDGSGSCANLHKCHSDTVAMESTRDPQLLQRLCFGFYSEHVVEFSIGDGCIGKLVFRVAAGGNVGRIRHPKYGNSISWSGRFERLVITYQTSAYFCAYSSLSADFALKLHDTIASVGRELLRWNWKGVRDKRSAELLRVGVWDKHPELASCSGKQLFVTLEGVGERAWSTVAPGRCGLGSAKSEERTFLGESCCGVDRPNLI